MKAFLPLVLALASCNVTTGSRVVVGNQRPAISPDSVKIYMRPPAKFEEVAMLNAKSKNAFASDQSLVDSAIARMKREAASMGANGVLLGGVGEQQVGAIGNSYGNAYAYGSGSGVSAYGTSFGSSTAIFAKVAQGTAIYVTKE
jgi:hypothetical protein